MSYLIIGAGSLLALCVCGYGSGIATALGAAAVSPEVLPAVTLSAEDRSETGRNRFTWATLLGLYNPFVSTIASLGGAGLLFKGASMIETGARATWSVGGDKFPRDLVSVSTLLRILAVSAVGWQGLRILKSYASGPRAIAGAVTRTGGQAFEATATTAATAVKAVLGSTEESGTEREKQDEELVSHSGYTALGIAALGGGMATALLMRTGEEKVFDDVLKNARLSIAASLMGGAALSITARLVRRFL